MLERIRAKCKERGMSVRQLEIAAGLAINTVCRWDENIPAVDKVKRVADVIGCTVDELLEDDDDG